MGKKWKAWDKTVFRPRCSQPNWQTIRQGLTACQRQERSHRIQGKEQDGVKEPARKRKQWAPVQGKAQVSKVPQQWDAPFCRVRKASKRWSKKVVDKINPFPHNSYKNYQEGYKKHYQILVMFPAIFPLGSEFSQKAEIQLPNKTKDQPDTDGMRNSKRRCRWSRRMSTRQAQGSHRWSRANANTDPERHKRLTNVKRVRVIIMQ